MNETTIEVVADHFQILFGDRLKAPLLDTSQLWDEEGQVAMLGGHSELVGIGIVRSGGNVRVTVSVCDMPMKNLVGWDWMGEFQLHVPSGKLVFWSPETENIEQCPVLSIEPGMYRGLVGSCGTDKVLDEMDPEGPDEYKVVLWPS